MSITRHAHDHSLTRGTGDNADNANFANAELVVVDPAPARSPSLVGAGRPKAEVPSATPHLIQIQNSTTRQQVVTAAGIINESRTNKSVKH